MIYTNTGVFGLPRTIINENFFVAGAVPEEKISFRDHENHLISRIIGNKQKIT